LPNIFNRAVFSVMFYCAMLRTVRTMLSKHVGLSVSGLPVCHILVLWQNGWTYRHNTFNAW